MSLKTIFLSLMVSLGSLSSTVWAQAKPSTGASPGGSDSDSKILVAAVLAFIAFLIIRELWCWFWKINALLNELREIKHLLRHRD